MATEVQFHAVEERIHALLAARDLRGAATEAIRGLGPEILRYLRATLREDGDAEEAFSVFAEHLWRGIGTYRGASSFRNWALRVASHAALNLRAEAWHRRRRRFATGEASALAARVSTSSAMRVERQRTALDRLRESLDVEDQMLLVLRIDQGLAWNDIAEVLAGQGKPPPSSAALMKRFERLKERLARKAGEEGLLP